MQSDNIELIKTALKKVLNYSFQETTYSHVSEYIEFIDRAQSDLSNQPYLKGLIAHLIQFTIQQNIVFNSADTAIKELSNIFSIVQIELTDNANLLLTEFVNRVYSGDDYLKESSQLVDECELDFVKAKGQKAKILFKDYLINVFILKTIANEEGSITFFNGDDFVLGFRMLEDLVSKHQNLGLIDFNVPQYIKNYLLRGLYSIDRASPSYIPLANNLMFVISKTHKLEDCLLAKKDTDKVTTNSIQISPNTNDLKKWLDSVNTTKAEELIKAWANNDDELALLLEEIMGCTFWHRAKIGGHSKSFILLGEGANGKSSFLDVIICLNGNANCSALSFQEMDTTTNRFKVAELLNKTVNIGTELPKTPIKETSTYKALQMGDPVSVEFKGKDSFPLINTAKFIFACNDVPYINDTSNGMKRRLCYVPFNNHFEEAPNFDKELKSKPMLEAFFVLGIKGLLRILSNGFTNPFVCQKLMKEIQKRDNQIMQWLDDMGNDICYLVTKPVNFSIFSTYQQLVTNKDMTDCNSWRLRYMAYLSNNGYKTDNEITTQTFIKEVIRALGNDPRFSNVSKQEYTFRFCDDVKTPKKKSTFFIGTYTDKKAVQ